MKGEQRCLAAARSGLEAWELFDLSITVRFGHVAVHWRILGFAIRHLLAGPLLAGHLLATLLLAAIRLLQDGEEDRRQLGSRAADVSWVNTPSCCCLAAAGKGQCRSVVLQGAKACVPHKMFSVGFCGAK